MDKKKVIILGAGPAGLASAYELSKDVSFDNSTVSGADSRLCSELSEKGSRKAAPLYWLKDKAGGASDNQAL